MPANGRWDLIRRLKVKHPVRNSNDGFQGYDDLYVCVQLSGFLGSILAPFYVTDANIYNENIGRGFYPENLLPLFYENEMRHIPE